jgi:Uma2 family endonuclease
MAGASSVSAERRNDMSQILENSAVRDMAMPMSVEQYHRLSESGIISERTELLCGVILEKMTKSPLHVYIVRRLFDWFDARAQADCHVRQEQPLTFINSELEPDLAVVQGNAEEFRLAHPATAKMIVEVAITSLELDREKAAVYAAANVPEYWIVIPDEQAIEVYTSPTSSGYQQLHRHEELDAPLVPSVFPEVSLTLRELFG